MDVGRWPGGKLGRAPITRLRSGLHLVNQDLQFHKTSVGITKLSLRSTAGLIRAFNTLTHIGTSKGAYKRYTLKYFNHEVFFYFKRAISRDGHSTEYTLGKAKKAAQSHGVFFEKSHNIW